MDPREVMMELEMLDAMELNLGHPRHPGQEVICRKRNECEEMWKRETELCAWEDPELHVELNKLWSKYLGGRRRKEMTGTGNVG